MEETGVPPGASAAEWAHWSLILGLTTDLLPVVSRIDARISPRSALKTLGKTPSRYDAERQVVGIAKWTKWQTTPGNLAVWAREPDYGICLQTRSVRALDIDIDDPAGAAQVRGLAEQHLGGLPLRIRAYSVRTLLLFRCAELDEKRRLETAAGIVELLATGQQCVVAGTHPQGSRYTWAGGLPDEIPTVTLAAFEDFWKALGGGREISTATQRRPSAGRRGALNSAAPATLAPPEDAVEGWLLARGWVRGHGAGGEVQITCPWETDHTTDSGDTETVYWPAGTGGFAQGHFKCLHAHCAARSDEEFLDAVGFRAADFADLPAAVVRAVAPPEPSRVVNFPGAATLISKLGLGRAANGIRPTLSNVVKALNCEGVWRRVAWDAFRGELVTAPWSDALGEERFTALGDQDRVRARLVLERAGFAPIAADIVRDALSVIGEDHSFDSAQLWLNAQRWDGTPRVAGFLEEYCGAEAHDGYAAAVSLYLWSALAGRVLEPGVKADMVPILVSGQGEKKSWSLQSLSPWPDGYVTLDLGARDAELARRMRGRVVWEIAELRGLHTREREAIKSFISETTDVWVPKYREFAVNAPRRGMFFGTSNTDEFLDDDTGNRRWLPVRVKAIQRERIVLDICNLWAEAACIFRLQGVVWDAAERLARAEHEAYLIGDSWTEEVSTWVRTVGDGLGRFTLRDVAIGIGLDIRQITRASEMRLSKILSSLGRVRSRLRGEGGVRSYYWILPD